MAVAVTVPPTLANSCQEAVRARLFVFLSIKDDAKRWETGNKFFSGLPVPATCRNRNSIELSRNAH